MARHRDRGAATVWAAIVVAAVAALAVAVIGVGAAVAARHRAAAAADLAALAGAGRAWSGGSVACAAARDITARMSTELRSCTLDGLVVTVRVGRRLAAFGWAEATARAGPAAGSGAEAAGG
ncbi:Rv3654c family TadE-like protein [Actinokineospora guangxiensis]|uniref:Rv3654c family TadE-like protein n=1 Tax=Actinokineospora guangxiensis TaxID=1490288 RepID=A0ABW0EKC0_9PSEU